MEKKAKKVPGPRFAHRNAVPRSPEEIAAMTCGKPSRTLSAGYNSPYQNPANYNTFTKANRRFFAQVDKVKEKHAHLAATEPDAFKAAVLSDLKLT